MSQKALDLRRSMQILRRHKVLLGIVLVLGVLGGAAYTVLKPPMLTSTALVALQPPPANAAAPVAASGTADTFTATQEIVAGSNQVLVGALPNVRPAMSLDELRHDVKIGSPSADLILVAAQGKKAADAEATANAVANSYIRYVTSPQSAIGRIQAQLLESASDATGPARIVRTIEYALLGGLAGALIGVIVALAVGRNDRRVRERDEIANSMGIPVLASIPVAHPSAAAGWTKLFEGYKPTAVHSLQLRSALRQLGMPRPGFGRRAHDGNGSSLYERASMHDGDGGRFSLMVLSLSSDSGALALGPQLAVFAASQGIPTSLVIGPHQDAVGTATLRTACAAPLSEASRRHGMLRVIAHDEGDVDLQTDTALVIVVAVVDSRAPKMPDTMRTNATVMGVSAGAATAEQLARAAMVSGADGREITGILVADPDPTDQTTGRISHLARPAPRRLPNRLRGVVTEIKR
jgi:capsular polysaccharide biosynthesis protein